MLRIIFLIMGLLGSGSRGDGWHSQISAEMVDSRNPQNLSERYNYTHEIDGEMARAFIAAYLDFQHDREIPQSKRVVANYTIKMKKEADRYRIFFWAKRTKASAGKGGESELGKDVEYTVSSTDYRIVDRTFFK